MMLTEEQLGRAVWGSGYGGRKHLVDRRRSQLNVAGPVGPYDEIVARCSGGVTLAVVDTWDPTGSRSGERLLAELARRPVCTSCAKIAGLVAAA